MEIRNESMSGEFSKQVLIDQYEFAVSYTVKNNYLTDIQISAFKANIPQGVATYNQGGSANYNYPYNVSPDDQDLIKIMFMQIAADIRSKGVPEVRYITVVEDEVKEVPTPIAAPDGAI